jgi:hypothetical protein
MSNWKKWLGARIASGAIIAAMLSAGGCSSWTQNQRDYATRGAIAGGVVGAGLGCGTAAIITSEHGNRNNFVGQHSGDATAVSYVIGCSVGILTGAAIGTAVGYIMAPLPPSPPLR